MSEKKEREWKAMSGRKTGKDGYQFGDVTRSLWNKVSGGNAEDRNDDKVSEKHKVDKNEDRINSVFSIRKTIKNIRRKSKDKVKVRTVNTNTGQIVESVDTADSRGWKCNEFVFLLVGATLSRGGIKRNTKGSVRKCFVQFELQEKWYNRTLPDGSTWLNVLNISSMSVTPIYTQTTALNLLGTVRWGHQGDIQKSKVISLCSDLCFYRADMPEDVTFRFKTRTFDAQIVVSLIEIMSNHSVKVLGQVTITANELMLRDLDQIVPLDSQIRNVSATEMFPLKTPKDDDANIGFLRMRASYVILEHSNTERNTRKYKRSNHRYTEKWGALCINMEPHFLPFEEAESGVSTEIRRFQNNITRISIAFRGINRFMKTLNDLFGWWDVGKTLVVVIIGLYVSVVFELFLSVSLIYKKKQITIHCKQIIQTPFQIRRYIIWMVPESYSFCIFPWLLVWHILYQRLLRRNYQGTHNYDKNLLQFDVANHADANIRLSVVAAHGLPLTDSSNNRKSDLQHASQSVVPEDPDDELSEIWCKALQRAAEIEEESEKLIADAKKIIKEYKDDGKTLDYWKMKTQLEEKYGEATYKACKSRVQAIKLEGDTREEVGRYICIRASSKYRSIFAQRPKWCRVHCLVKDGQMSWGDSDDTTKHTFKCELLNLKLLEKRDETDVAFVVESTPGTKHPWRYWIRLRSAAECRSFFGRIREEKITAEAVAKQAKYLDIKTIKKIESSLLTGNFYKMGNTRWKKRKMTLSDTTLVYQGASFWGKTMKIVPTGDISRVDIKEPNTQTPIGLPLSKYDDYYGSKKSILHFVKTEQGKLDPDQTTDLIFWFESDKIANLWKSKMDKIIEERRGGGYSESSEEEEEEEGREQQNEDNVLSKNKKRKNRPSMSSTNKNLSDPELATQLIDDFSQGRLGFLEGDLNNDYAKVLIAGVFCWYMDVTFVRHSTRLFFYPSHQPTHVLNGKDIFHGPDFVDHMKSLNRKIRDQQFVLLQEFLVSRHLMIHVMGPASLLSEDSYWRFNNRRARTLGKFINTTYEIEHVNDRSNPDAFVSVYLHNGKDKTRYIGRTNTEYMTTKPVFGTNANKPLGTGVIDKILAFARKSRNRLFRVHRDLELLKWHNKLEGMGVRQWYWAFGFTTPRPVVTDKGGFYGDSQNMVVEARDRNVSRLRSFDFHGAGKKFLKTESKFSSGDLGNVFDEEDDNDEEELPVLQIKNVNQSPSSSLGATTPPATPFGFGLYPDDVERAVDEESKRVEECPKLPPEPLRRKEHGILLPWSECTDVLEFKIWDEDFSVAEGFGDEEIGNCRVKLMDFIPNPTSEGAKGRQPEIWKWIPVKLYNKHEKEQRRLGRSTGKGNAWLLVRCQVVLRQGDKDVNFDDSKSGYLYLYNRTISVIKYINDFLEEAVVFYEKFKNLLNWTHPRKTQATLIIMVVFSIFMMHVPLKLLFIGAFMFPFTGIFRPPGGLMWMSEHVISSIPDDMTRRKTLENKAPLRLDSLPRATHLPGVVMSAYVQHAMARTGVDGSVPEDQEWKLHFLALTPDGWLFWWDSHEDGLTAITKACERTRNPDENFRIPRRMTSWWGGSTETGGTKKHKRERSQSVVDFVEESPVIQAKAWRALGKFADESKSKKEKMKSEAAELIDGSFHVKASEFSYRRRREHGEWHTITFKAHGTSSSTENCWLAFRREDECDRWISAFRLFASPLTS